MLGQQVAAEPVPGIRPADGRADVDVAPLTARRAPWFVVSVVAAAASVLVALVRAVARPWVPVGDNALYDIRARDVFTEHHPLIGTWSSASVSADSNVNHPGPLLFDLLALPARVFGETGVAVGVGLLNLAAVVAIALVARRRAGPLIGAVAAVVAAALAWTMGSGVLVEPWSPHTVLLPFLLFLLLVWSLVAGDGWALPWAVAVGSFVLQVHLSYAFLVPLLLAWGVGSLVVGLRRDRHREADRGPGPRARVGRSMAAATVVGVLLWAQPLWEQLVRDGNMVRLLGTLDDPTGKLGAGFGTRLWSSIVALPPWWVRPSFDRPWLPLTTANSVEPRLAELPGAPAAVAGLMAVLALLAWCAWRARRRRDADLLALVGTAAVGLVVALLTTARAPIELFGIAPHQFRWLWPLAAFATFAVAVTLLRTVAPRQPSGPRARAAGWGLAGLTVVLAVLNVPASDQGVSAPLRSMAVVRDLGGQLDDLEDEGTVLVDLAGEGFADPYGMGVIAALRRRDVDVVLRDPVLLRQLGPSRELRDGDASTRLFLRYGDEAGTVPDGARRVALHRGLDGEEEDELALLQPEIEKEVRSGRLRLTDRGERAVEREEVEPPPTPGEAARFTRFGGLATLVENDFLALDGDDEDRFRRWADLRLRGDRETVAVLVEPLT